MGFISSDGSEHESSYDQMHHERNVYGDSGSSGGGGAAGAAAKGGMGIIILVILAIPAIAAKAIGVIFAFLFKLGIIGKILQTVVVSVLCLIIMAFATGMFSGEVFATLGIPVIVMAALWYWLFHYDEIKSITIKEFSNNITVCFAIVIYGFVGVVLLSSILAALFGDTAAHIIFMTLLLTLFAIAIINYFGATKPYREEAAKVRTNPERKKKIFKVAAICMGVLIVMGAITSFLPDSMKLIPDSKKIKIDIDLSGRSKTESSTDTRK
jgi:hypothetical protein